MTNRPDDALDILSEFYAVVLDHQMGSGQRVRWSPSCVGWLRSRDYGRYMQDPWDDAPGETHGRPDAPTEEATAAAVALANSVVHPGRTPFFCQRCWTSTADSHFIAPDIYGDPELYCLQIPDLSVVDSSGGSGRVKHWGSPFGCQSVEAHIESDALGRRPYIGPQAAYVFGRPLPANEVINREWCSRCCGTADNVRSNASARGEDEWTRKEVQKHVRRLRRSLAEYYGEDG